MYDPSMSQLHKVAEISEVPPGTAVAVDVEGRRIAVFNVDGSFYAIDDTCPHAGAPLSEGDVDGSEVTCPWHNATFDLNDGSVQCPPAEEGVTCYPVQVQGSEIFIALEP